MTNMNDKSARTKLMPCNCKNEFMDTKYGKGRRVSNPLQLKGRIVGYRCASCAAEFKS